MMAQHDVYPWGNFLRGEISRKILSIPVLGTPHVALFIALSGKILQQLQPRPSRKSSNFLFARPIPPISSLFLILRRLWLVAVQGCLEVQRITAACAGGLSVRSSRAC